MNRRMDKHGNRRMRLRRRRILLLLGEKAGLSRRSGAQAEVRAGVFSSLRDSNCGSWPQCAKIFRDILSQTPPTSSSQAGPSRDFILRPYALLPISSRQLPVRLGKDQERAAMSRKRKISAVIRHQGMPVAALCRPFASCLKVGIWIFSERWSLNFEVFPGVVPANPSKNRQNQDVQKQGMGIPAILHPEDKTLKRTRCGRAIHPASLFKGSFPGCAVPGLPSSLASAYRASGGGIQNLFS